jgi:hypothetical protein
VYIPSQSRGKNGVTRERAYTTREINNAVRKHLSPSKPVKIKDLEGHPGVAAGLSGEGKVTITGRAGDFLGAFLDGPEVHLTGSAGDFAGSTMLSGRLVVEGAVGRGFCCHMAGGLARVKGRSGASAGAMMTGGVLVLEGPVGPRPGEGQTGGTLVLLRPSQLPSGPPRVPARLIVPRGTGQDLAGFVSLEMDHEEVEELADALGTIGVATPEKVAELLVRLVPPEATVGNLATPEAADSGVVLDLLSEGEEEAEDSEPVEPKKAQDKSEDPSSRFEDFAKEVKSKEGGK